MKTSLRYKSNTAASVPDAIIRPDPHALFSIMEEKYRSLEVIDISAFTTTREASEEEIHDLLQAWDRAFKTHGFALITGHGVPPPSILDIQTDAREFFKQPADVKMKSCLGSGYGNGGYVPVGIESVARSRDMLGTGTGDRKPPDMVENICFHEGASDNDIVPDSPARLKTSVQNYWKCMQQLLDVVMKISALSLGLQEDYFTPFYSRPENSLRLAYYPAQDKVQPKPNQLRYGAHTDYTGFTLLRPDDKVGGLEILDPQTSSWFPVQSVNDCFIVNGGDLIQQWTNDHWISNLHRVVNPPADLRHHDRLSVVFFTGPNTDAVVSPLDVCCGKEHPPKYAPVVAGDYLRSKLNITNI